MVKNIIIFLIILQCFLYGQYKECPKFKKFPVFIPVDTVADVSDTTPPLVGSFTAKQDSTVGVDSLVIAAEDFNTDSQANDSLGFYFPDTNVVDTSYYTVRINKDGQWQDTLSAWYEYPEGGGGGSGVFDTVFFQDDYSSTTGELHNSLSLGQAFTTINEGSSYSVDSIQIYIAAGGPAPTQSGYLAWRIGTTSNLTSYVTNAYDSVLIENGFGTGVYTLIYDENQPTLTSNTTYYFGMTFDMPDYRALYIDRAENVVTGDSYYNVDGSWNLASSSSSRDLYLVIWGKRND